MMEAIMPATLPFCDAEVARLAKELARQTGTTEVEAVRQALRHMLRRESAALKGDRRDDQPPAQAGIRAARKAPPVTRRARDEETGRARDEEEAAMRRVRVIVGAAAATRRDSGMTDEEILGYPEMFPDLYRKP
ncbi:MAG: hypothetical protein COY86_10725 [Rhodobacterales bacterium CG_4_10_14_0_8_um_filter_70_9]|nr:MAG: hypothetical protein COY86_10725 [Rhodobacterales bacterium CG_4_10_14_0_8_um_filter_70_9]